MYLSPTLALYTSLLSRSYYGFLSHLRASALSRDWIFENCLRTVREAASLGFVLPRAAFAFGILLLAAMPTEGAKPVKADGAFFNGERLQLTATAIVILSFFVCESHPLSFLCLLVARS